MPTSSPVYQPTTVTYESQSPPERWTNRPVSYLSATVSRTARGPCLNQRECLPYALLIFGLLILAAGIAMIVEGSVRYDQIQIDDKENTDGDLPEPEQNTADLIVAISGGIFVIVALVLLGIYLRQVRYIRTCCRSGKDLEAIRGQASTMNPSTDFLVAAQYAPVSEVAYQPPQPLQDDTDTERSKLMSDNKECVSGEESDRMLDTDPRIVLRPLNKVSEDA